MTHAIELKGNSGGPVSGQMLSKVPAVTLYFWIIKVLCTTVGETASDFLNVNLNFGLKGTSIVTGVLLLGVFGLQFRTRKYVPGIYWVTVVLVSVFGTLVTDNLTDALGLPLEASTIGFSVLLALTFVAWYAKEKTLSIHSILTARREVFYWLTILFTFALGTASGDLMAEKLGLGYSLTGLIICVVIAVLAVAWRLGLNSILAFWLIYICTRPLGASLGDYLSQSKKYGGLGLGATATSAVFLAAIFVTVLFLTFTKRDMVRTTPADREDERNQKGGLLQVAVVVSLLIALSGIGYHWRSVANNADAVLLDAGSNPPTSTAPSSGSSRPATAGGPLGDVTGFRTITQDTLALVNSGKLEDAKTRAADLEHDWDVAQARLKPKNPAKWTELDDAIDKVLRQLRAVSPNLAACKSSLEALLAVLDLDH